MIDWDAGQYEQTAADLAPVAEHVVALAALRPGERVADLACGTGNAALLAAAAGAQVTGLDGAQRLVEVARNRAAEEGVSASFVVGDLQDLPFEADSLDVVLSVFGVIFASEPQRAFAEIVRVLRPGGRALISAWVPDGPIHAMTSALVAGLPAPRRRGFPWHDYDAVAGLAAPHGAEVELHSGALAFTAGSPEAYLASAEEHPLTIAIAPALEQAGTAASAREQALAALRAGNEDPAGFRVSSPYRVVEVRLGGVRT